MKQLHDGFRLDAATREVRSDPFELPPIATADKRWRGKHALLQRLLRLRRQHVELAEELNVRGVWLVDRSITYTVVALRELEQELTAEALL